MDRLNKTRDVCAPLMRLWNIQCWHKPQQGGAGGGDLRGPPRALGIGLPREAPWGCTWVGVSSPEM